MKKIAVPITENNQIENHFGRSKYYEIYTFSNTNEILELQLIYTEQGFGCKSKFINTLANKGVTSILSNAIGNKAAHKLNNAGITVIRGCSGNSADVILEFIEDKIYDNSIGCPNHKNNKFCNH